MKHETDLKSKKLFQATTANMTIHHATVDTLQYQVLRKGEKKLMCWKLPQWQRGSVWTKEQEVKLVESLWLGLPIASYVYNETRNMRGSKASVELDGILIDGQQRWTTLEKYLNDELEVMGYTWKQLGKLDQRAFLMKPFPAIITSYEDEELLKDLYNRLAYGGTAHSAKND